MEIANDALRFALELLALGATSYWGWQRGDDGTRWLLALGLPPLLATVWGVFRVPDDPREAPVAGPGAVRPVIEAVFFGLAVGATWSVAGTG